MREIYTKRRKTIGVLAFAIGLFAGAPIMSKAQSVEVYGYVSKVKGQIVSSQDTLKVLPGQEIEYVVEIRGSVSQNYSAAAVTISLPYYADFYGIDGTDTVYYGGAGGTDLFYDPVTQTLVWNGLTIPTAVNNGDLLARLTYTVVSSQDCYALSASCGKKEIVIEGSLTGMGSTTFKYGYYGGVSTTVPDTVTIVDIPTFLASSPCDGQPNRQYVYLEDPSGTTTIQIADIEADFPLGADFYNEIDEITGIPISGSPLVSFPKDWGKDSGYAVFEGNCWQKFYVNVLDTSNYTFCAGEKLDKAMAWASDWDAVVANSGDWYLDQDIIDPITKVLSLTDNNKTFTYKAKWICDSSEITSNVITIIVHDTATITAFNPETVYCYGETLGARVVVDMNDDAVTYEWTLGGTVFGGDNDTVTYPNPLTTANNGEWLKVVITNSCGIREDSVKITVNPKPFIKDTLATICSGSTFIIEPTDGVHNDTVPTGTTYKWTVPTNSLGATSQSSPQTEISEALTNTTNTVQSVTYTVIPETVTGANTCEGDPFNIVVTVNPMPNIEDTVAVICSGTSFTVTPSNGGGTSHGDVVPSNTLYTWEILSADQNANIPNASDENTPQSSIGQPLTNTTNTNQQITYTVTPISSGTTPTCTGSTFRITVTVEPTPVIAKKFDTICYGEAFEVIPVDGGGGGIGDIVPSGTTYTWDILYDNANITEQSAETTPQSKISQTLKNTTFVPQQITYEVTPLSGNCQGAKFEVEVVVNPLPEIIIGNNTDMCVRDTNTLTITSSSSLVGGSWKSLTPAIATVNSATGLVTAISDGTATIQYTVATSEGCVDSATTTITVLPLPVLSMSANSICEGTTAQLSSSGVAGKWVSLNPSIATVVDSTGLVTGVAFGTTRFIFTDTATGCSDTTGVLTVGTFPSVDPITAPRNAACATGAPITLECNSPNGEWSLSNKTVATFVGSSPYTGNTVTVYGQTVGQVYVTYTVGSGTCQSKSTYLLKIVDGTTPPTIIIGFER